MSNKLFVFGCSYATGEELLMHRLGELDAYRISTADDPRKFFKRLELENRQDEYEEIKLLQKEIAWPKQLSDKLNLNCVNLAESGNSFDKMLYQIYEQVYHGNISKEDTIIVSLTKTTRNAVFDNKVESFQLPSLYWPVKSLIGVKDTGDMKPVIDEKTDIALLQWFTDDRILWDYVKNLQAVRALKENFNLHIVPAMKNNIKTNIPLIEKLYQDCANDFLTDKGLDDFSNDRLAWGHPDQVAHDKYAEYLYDILR